MTRSNGSCPPFTYRPFGLVLRKRPILSLEDPKSSTPLD
jgi:hypothetical protein